MPFKMGPLEIGLILLVIIMVFGVGKLPQVGEALGKAIHSFRQNAANAVEEEAVSTMRKKRASRKKTAKAA
jgi:sec-independent protein translocase protein TatA